MGLATVSVTAASADAVLESNVRVQIAFVSDFVLLTMSDLITTKVDRARLLLVEAKNAGDAKKVMDMAHAAETYAKRQKLSDEVIGHAHEIKTEAQRLLGEFLENQPKNVGAKGSIVTGSRREPVKDRTPTLASVGISKKESASAQLMARIAREAPEKFEAVKTGKVSVSKALREVKRKERESELDQAQAELSAEAKEDLRKVCDIRHCSMEDLFESGVNPDAVITDLPYPKKFLPLYGELAKRCAKAKVPLVAVMCGQSYLPEIMNLMTPHLKYLWTMAYLVPGGQSATQWETNVNIGWKPVLLFGELSSRIGDVVSSDVNDNDKRFHDWGQSESGIARLVERLTKPGQLVCDPFLGGGTTAVVCRRLARRFVGCDIDAEVVDKAWLRVEALPD